MNTELFGPLKVLCVLIATMSAGFAAHYKKGVLSDLFTLLMLIALIYYIILSYKQP